ncbi:MAG: hypothetical protein AAB453_01560 [Patescibacteria group bacterium]
MKLKNFIKKLEKISKKYSGNLEVVMADNIAVIKPIFKKNFRGCSKVIITDGI